LLIAGISIFSFYTFLIACRVTPHECSRSFGSSFARLRNRKHSEFQSEEGGFQDGLERFFDFFTLATAFNDALKKAYDICQIKPESAIDALRIKPT